MSIQSVHLPYQGMMAGFHRFSVAEYHHLIQLGMLTEDDPLELLEGYLVCKMPRNPPHDSTIQQVMKRLFRGLPPGWDVRGQSAVTLSDSEPEPDFAVVRGDEKTYRKRHPGPADIGIVIEVADSSLPGDRDDKGRIYSRAGIPIYWIINLQDAQVEVYSGPSGPVANPAYAQRTDYRAGDVVPLVLDGTVAGTLPAADLLP
jgi:Uma2 family endonuclease